MFLTWLVQQTSTKHESDGWKLWWMNESEVFIPPLWQLTCLEFVSAQYRTGVLSVIKVLSYSNLATWQRTVFVKVFVRKSDKVTVLLSFRESLYQLSSHHVWLIFVSCTCLSACLVFHRDVLDWFLDVFRSWRVYVIHGGLHTNASKASATFGEFTYLIFLIQKYTDPQTNRSFI
jgi:hypothetical protein